jgi:hypothetical protein
MDYWLHERSAGNLGLYDITAKLSVKAADFYVYRFERI